MVQALIKISRRTNRVIDMVKIKHGLRTKGEAVERIVEEYERELLEPEFKPEFVDGIIRASKRKGIPIKNFRKHFGLE